MIESFAGHSTGHGGYLWYLTVSRISIKAFLAFRGSTEKSGFSLIGLPLYTIWSFFLTTFNILYSVSLEI